MGARWYSPSAGDFTSADTIQVSPVPDPAAGNPFAYAGDEPLDATDPTGHMPLNLYYDAPVVPRGRPAPPPPPPSYYLAQALSRIHVTAARLKPADAHKPPPKTKTKPKPRPAATSLGLCSGNITACLALNYSAHGGQFNSQGIPTGRGYPPGPPGSDTCNPRVCHDIITGQVVGPAGAPAIGRPATQPGRSGTSCGRPARFCHIERFNQLHPAANLWHWSRLGQADYLTYSSQGCFWVCISTGFTVSRYGNVYFSLGLGAGTPNVSDSIRFGWVDQKRPPTPKDLNTFISSWSADVNVSGKLLFGPGAQGTWGNPGHLGSHNFATEAGVGVGLPGVSAEGTYTWDLFHI